jgi:hypothetical protein
MLFLALVIPVLFAAALFSRAQQAVLERRIAEDRKPLEQAATQIPLVNVQAPEGFVAPITVTISDAAGRRFPLSTSTAPSTPKPPTDQTLLRLKLLLWLTAPTGRSRAGPPVPGEGV